MLLLHEEEKFSMIRSEFKDIMAKAHEDQKNWADATSAEANQAAFTKGAKHGSEIQDQPVHSSPMEVETVRQNPIAPSSEHGLNAIHQLRPATSIAMANIGVVDSNKTLQTMSSSNTGKRYKRETNLKFSDGSVKSYESLRSQFNIHHKMLGWDTRRAGVELYVSLEVKAALKVTGGCYECQWYV